MKKVDIIFMMKYWPNRAGIKEDSAHAEFLAEYYERTNTLLWPNLEFKAKDTNTKEA